MREVGIRELKQNASAVVAEVANGDYVTITDRGRPVAMLVPIKSSRVEELIAAGLARPALRSLRDLPPAKPRRRGQRPLSQVLQEMRDDERY